MEILFLLTFVLPIIGRYLPYHSDVLFSLRENDVFLMSNGSVDVL